jgi:hypothetical protein
MVRFGFGFISLKLKKPNRTEPKPEKTESNRKKPSQTKPKPSQTRKKPSQTEKPSQTGFCPKNRTETGRFEPVLVFFYKKKFGLVTFFLYKNRIKSKIITLISLL